MSSLLGNLGAEHRATYILCLPEAVRMVSPVADITKQVSVLVTADPTILAGLTFLALPPASNTLCDLKNEYVKILNILF